MHYLLLQFDVWYTMYTVNIMLNIILLVIPLCHYCMLNNLLCQKLEKRDMATLCISIDQAYSAQYWHAQLNLFIQII